MLGKEVVFFCKPNVLVLQKEYDRRSIAQTNTLFPKMR